MRYIPDISGMVKVENAGFITVHDAKNIPGRTGPRLGLLRLNTLPEQVNGQNNWLPPTYPVDYQQIEIHNWTGDLPNDLEAICAIPPYRDRTNQYRTNEFLLAESGYYKNDYGRVFHVRIDPQGYSAYAELLASFNPFVPPRANQTPEQDEIEGMWCLRNRKSGKMMLIFALRGKTPVPARLVWGELKGLGTPNPSFPRPVPPANEYKIDNARRLGIRGASTLLLRGAGRKFEAWTAATIDQGEYGPFRSVIYSVGKFHWQNPTTLAFTGNPANKLKEIVVPALKVEGLAEPAVVVLEDKKTKERTEKTLGFFSIAADDERYGGIWRPLPNPNLQVDPETGEIK